MKWKHETSFTFRFQIHYIFGSKQHISQKKSAAVQMKSFQDSVATCVQLCFHCWFHPAFYYWLKILQQSPSIVTIFFLTKNMEKFQAWISRHCEFHNYTNGKPISTDNVSHIKKDELTGINKRATIKVHNLDVNSYIAWYTFLILYLRVILDDNLFKKWYHIVSYLYES